MLGLSQINMSAQFTPAQISPILWVDCTSSSYISTIDNNGVRGKGNIINSATAKTGQALTTAGTLGSKPIFNGEGWYCETGSQVSTGVTSSYNFIHNGSDFDIWVSVFLCPTATTTYGRAFICNNGFSNTNKGILLRANSTGNNNLECRIGNGVSAFISLTGTAALTVNRNHVIRVTRSGATATMFVNGVSVATQTIVASAGTGDAAGLMSLGTNTGATLNVYMKDVVIFDRALTSNEATKMNGRRFLSIIPEPINVYILLGDSNCAGRGSNAAIASDLTGSIPNTFMETFVGAPDSTSWAGKLLLGTNQTISSENPSTQHGAEMRFGKSMGVVKETCIIKWGRGSHSMFARGGAYSPDFNISSASGAYSQLVNTALPTALNDLVHAQRKSPVFRGITFLIGANDATFAYQSVPWTRSGTSATLTRSFHGLVVGGAFAIYNSTDTSAIPTGLYTITANTSSTFTVTVPNAGGTSGTASYSGAYYFKQNSYDVINGIITNLTSTIKNQVTNGTGYTVNKLRLYFPRTYAISTVNSEAYTQTTTAQTEMGTSFLTDNPSRSSNVLGSYSEGTSDLTMQDGVHYSTSGYDGLGAKMASYYIPYVNE